MVKPRVKTLKGNLQGLGDQSSLKADRCLLVLLLLGTWNAPYRTQSPWMATAHFRLPLTQPGVQDSCTLNTSFYFFSCRKVKTLFLETPCPNRHFHATLGRYFRLHRGIHLSVEVPEDIRPGPRQVTPGLALPVCQALNNAFCSFQILPSLS